MYNSKSSVMKKAYENVQSIVLVLILRVYSFRTILVILIVVQE